MLLQDLSWQLTPETGIIPASSSSSLDIISHPLRVEKKEEEKEDTVQSIPTLLLQDNNKLCNDKQEEGLKRKRREETGMYFVDET